VVLRSSLPEDGFTGVGGVGEVDEQPGTGRRKILQLLREADLAAQLHPRGDGPVRLQDSISPFEVRRPVRLGIGAGPGA
jgi:hypothetical protein